MGVCDHNLFDLEVVFADERENFLNVVARVDDQGFASGFVANDGAVALQRADGENFVDHGFIVATAGWLLSVRFGGRGRKPPLLTQNTREKWGTHETLDPQSLPRSAPQNDNQSPNLRDT